jgi:hypothetical protein
MAPQTFDNQPPAPFTGIGNADAPRPGPWTPLGYPTAGGGS